MVASRTEITQQKWMKANANLAAKAAVEAERMEENDEYKDAIEECALAMSQTGDLTAEVKSSEEGGASATGAAPKVPEAAVTKGNGKGKGGTANRKAARNHGRLPRNQPNKRRNNSSRMSWRIYLPTQPTSWDPYKTRSKTENKR